MTRRPRINRFNSIDLMKSLSDKFRLRIQKTEDFAGDDALTIVRRSSDIFDTILDSVMVVGSFPWENDTSRRILYRFPSADGQNNQNDDSIINFVLPEIKRKDTENHNISFDSIEDIEESGLNHVILKNTDAEYFKSNLIDDCHILKSKFFPLYMPTDANTAPYVYCLTFYVSIFNLPSISHNFSIKDLSQHISKYLESKPSEDPTKRNFDIHFTRLCLLVKTKLPFHTLFQSFLTWLLQCELVGRMPLFQPLSEFCDYLLSQSPDDVNPPPSFFKDNTILETQRSTIQDFIEIFSALSAPLPNQELSIDRKPYPSFHWRRNDDSITYFSLAKLATTYLLDAVGNPENFVRLFFSLLLERSIFVYSPDIQQSAWIVLAFHFLLRPLNWVSVTVSLLPPNLNELLDAPYPLIAGLCTELDFDDVQNLPRNSIYINVEKSLFVSPYSRTEQIPCVSVWQQRSHDDENEYDDDDDSNDEGSVLAAVFTTEKDYQKKKWGTRSISNSNLKSLSTELFSPPAPQQKTFLEDIEMCWSRPNKASSILTVCNHFISCILKEIDACIITNISDPERTSSIFMEELFIKCFPLAERAYIKNMTTTQLFHFFIEQKCRLRSERNKVSHF